MIAQPLGKAVAERHDRRRDENLPAVDPLEPHPHLGRGVSGWLARLRAVGRATGRIHLPAT